ncbi:hypothetical protein MSG28_008236 [Choristoneura fumiferana]|uniref:Uncharacterized protein n=1 Tax=Choristoneura fumiferana TaxID=7141 RepID=A0ACC0JAK7_CHOFU|nr:hypothetical protein MSG28_008236 [Choristoneura fumiferana]
MLIKIELLLLMVYFNAGRTQSPTNCTIKPAVDSMPMPMVPAMPMIYYYPVYPYYPYPMPHHHFLILFYIILSLTALSDCRKAKTKPKEPKPDLDFLDLVKLDEETNSTPEIPDVIFPDLNDGLIPLLKDLKLKSSAGEYEPNSNVVYLLQELKDLELQIHPEKKRAKELGGIIDDLIKIQQLV